jgi:hypothetical protein
MAKAGYSAQTGAAVGLLAATAKTIIFVTGTANFGMDWKKYRLSFDGVTASAVPVFVELNYNTAATNSTAGTGNTNLATTPNIQQIYGRAITLGFTGGYNCSSEPTVQTNVDAYLLTPNGGTVVYDCPLGDVPDAAVSNGFSIRLTAPAVVNARASMFFERI